jgi:hypothetical protein
MWGSRYRFVPSSEITDIVVNDIVRH